MGVDLILYGGKIHTLDPVRPYAEAVAISGHRIAAVGTNRELRGLLSRGTEVLDLRGQAVLPAFTDCHVHFLSYALRLNQIDLSGLRSRDAVLEAVATRAAETTPGRWLQGGGWDRNLWPDSSFPDRGDLDRVAPLHQVALSSKCGHALWANSRALAAAGVTAGTSDPEGGEIVRCLSTGEPTGILKERATELVHQAVPPPSPEVAQEAMALAVTHLHRVGLTGIHDFEGKEAFQAIQRLAVSGELRVRVLMHLPSDGLDAAVDLGLRSGLGDDMLRVGSVKLFADGSLGSRTAAMIDVYDSEPANRGIMVHSEEVIEALVHRACQAGLAPAIHAIGDRAIHVVLNAYEASRPMWTAQGLRPRIEHAQLLTPHDIGRLGRLGVIASMQPIHCTADMEMVDRYWGVRRVGAYAFRSLLNCGAHLAFGSDCPVENVSPLAGIHAAVTRRRADGSPTTDGWEPDERITVGQAVRAYTLGAAYASGEERDKGSITPGKLADLVLLSQDIFAIDPMDIALTEVSTTILNGRPMQP